jgi:hypothetical protein
MMPTDTVHYARSLTMPTPVCQTANPRHISLDPERVTCAQCARKLPLQAQPEKYLLARIRFLARQAGWLIYHTHNSKRSEPGFPDLCLVKPRGGPRHRHRGRLILAELKREGEQPTIVQQAWLDALATIAGVETYLWHPSDMPRIVEILTEDV